MTEKINPKGCKDQSSNSGIEYKSDDIAQVEYITEDTGFSALREDWIRLHDCCETAGLFNSWYWSRLWWQHYGDRSELFIVVVRVDGTIQGIAPFYRCKTRIAKLHTVSTLRFIGSGEDTSPDDLGILYDEEFEDCVTRLVCQSAIDSSHCQRLQLTDTIEDSLFVRTLLGCSQRNHWGRPLKHYQHRRVSALPRTIDAFVDSLSKNARKQHRRRNRKLYASTQSVEFIACASQADIDRSYGHLLRLHNLRHANSGGSDSFQTDRYREFHRCIMKTSLGNQELRLLSLVVDGNTIGVEYGFLCKHKLYLFQTGYDPAFSHLCPGHLLMMETIDRGIDDGANHLDLLKGDHVYKQTYAKQIKTTLDLDLWKSPLLSTISRGLRLLSNRLKNRG